MSTTADAKVPGVGDAAPTFNLEAVLPVGSRGPVVLLDVLREAQEAGGRGVIVYFYPKAATPGCTAEACDFRDSLEPLRRAGYSVIGVSPDGLDAIDSFREQEHLTFPLASDPDKAVATAFGAFGERNVMGRVGVGLIRSTFVVGADGRITHALRNVKAKGHVGRLRTELGV